MTAAHHHRFLAAAVGVIAIAAGGGCETTYDARYLYEPRPVELQPAAGSTSAADVRTLASIVGIRQDDADIAHPATAEARLRIENHAGQPVTVPDGALSLVTGDLVELEDAVVVPPLPAEIAPGEVQQFTAYFPFPGGEYAGRFDLRGLNLRLRLLVGGQLVQRSATVTRIEPRRWRDPYPYRAWPYGSYGTGVGFGVGVGF